MAGSIPKALKRLFLALGAFAGVLLIAAVAVMAFIDVEDYKPRIESAASAATGMTVTIEGPLRIGFRPSLNVVLGNVRVVNRGSQVALVETVDVGIEVMPLLRRDLKYTGITLEGARFSIERGTDRRFNFQKPDSGAKQYGGMALSNVSFPSAQLSYLDKASDTGFETGMCSGEVKDMRHPGGKPFLAGLSLDGQVSCKEVRGKDRAASDVKFTLVARDGVFDFKPFTMRLAGGQGSGSVRIDRSQEVQAVHVDYALSNFRIEQYLKKQRPDRQVKGEMDFSAKLSMRGKSREELKRSANGAMTLSGTGLTLVGMDLDQAFGKYAATQEFNILDLGAMLVAGPVGLLATKGYELSTLSEKSGGSTQIRTVMSRWKVEKGVARAQDVAMATAENRVALQGGLDFVRGEYADMVMARVDAGGCAKLRQRISGPFTKPSIEKPGALKTIAGPVVNVIGKAREAITGETQCEPFYQGKVAPPK